MNSKIHHTIMKNFMILCHISSVLKKNCVQISGSTPISGHLFPINRALHSDHRGKYVVLIGVGAASLIAFQRLPNKYSMSKLLTTILNSQKIIVFPCLWLKSTTASNSVSQKQAGGPIPMWMYSKENSLET